MKLPALVILLFFSAAGCRSTVRRGENQPAFTQAAIAEASADQEPTGNGIVYFSSDMGASWEDRSTGLPEDVNLTDLAATDSSLLLTTKQNGLFQYDFQRNSWRHTPSGPPTSSNLDVLNLYQGKIWVGSQQDGIFISANQGKSWSRFNEGLQNLTIRRIVALSDQILLGTNAGLYALDEKANKWVLIFGNPTLQVNGITHLDGEIYIGTNQGIFKSDARQQNWRPVLADRSLHNLSADDRAVYAMVYNELFVSTDKGQSWQSDQAGLPPKLYTFQLRARDGQLFAAQWDGVYRKTGAGDWLLSSTGLPEKFAATELIFCGNTLVTASSGRRAKQ